MKTIRILFDQSGLGRCFYTEAIDLASLGTLLVERVSTIEWAADVQLWQVRNNEGLLLFSDPSRSHCVTWEEDHFSQLISIP